MNKQHTSYTLLIATLTAAVLLISSSVNVGKAADVDITAVRHEGITVDGVIGDWDGVPATNIKLVNAVGAKTTATLDAVVKVAYDDSNIYVLVIIEDDFDYNPEDHDKSGAIAVLFAIDEAATPDMGGGKGAVDIWHWELDVGPGVVAGYNLNSGDDPVGNLDDEWATDPFTRSDDEQANEVYGAWTHTGKNNGIGAAGQWIFEFKRPLKTSDPTQDAQFEVGGVAKMAIAYWDADEKGEAAGWSDAGHLASCKDPNTRDFSWLVVRFKKPEVPQVGVGAAEVQQLEKKISTLDSLAKDLSGKVSSLESSIKSLKSSVDKVTADTSGLSSGLNDVKSAVSALKSQVNNLQPAIQDVKSSVEAVRSAAAEARDIAVGLTGTVNIALAIAVISLIIAAASIFLARKK